MSVVLVAPVYGNSATLPALATRVARALSGRDWRLRLVIDGSPDQSLAVAGHLAVVDPRIGVTALAVNGGQHRALLRGLECEPQASAWVCLDADLQDPPEAVPALLARLAVGDAGAVFAGRRGSYEAVGRRATGALHRLVLSRITGLPPDAGAFVAMAPEVRHAVVRLKAPSVVAAIGVCGLPVASIPVERARRAGGRSAWTSSTRLRHSLRTLAWAASSQR